MRFSQSGIAQSARRIEHLVKKEFIHIIRNRQNFKLLILAPVIQLILFGYACRLDVQDVQMVIVDQDKSVMSRQLLDAFSRSGYFVIVERLDSYDHADHFLRKGLAAIALLIPPDFERKIQSNSTSDLGVMIDGVDTITAGTVSGYVQAILSRFVGDISKSHTNSMQGLLYESSNPRLIVPEVTDVSRAWFNPNLVSKEYFVPGVVVLILLSLSIIVTSAVIVREKEIGTIEQLMVAPISRLELILGKTIPCFCIEIVTLAIVIPMAFLIFDIPFRGSFTFFLGTAFLFLFTSSGIGMMISVFCNTQQQAILTSFMFLQPSVLLSGYAFPIENMPPVVQYVTYLNPLRYFITIVRGVFLKGVGLEVLWPQVIPIVLIGLVAIGLASGLFKRRAD